MTPHPRFSRLASSREIASRMNWAMPLGSTRASMRCLVSRVMRILVTTVTDFSFSGGRPIRRGISAPEIFVKTVPISVPAY